MQELSIINNDGGGNLIEDNMVGISWWHAITQNKPCFVPYTRAHDITYDIICDRRQSLSTTNSCGGGESLWSEIMVSFVYYKTRMWVLVANMK